MSQPLQFHGQYKDSVLGLYDMRQRDYNPVTGMFLATDPVPVPVGAPFISRYSYGFNNPLVFNDASGLEARPWKDGRIVGIPVAGGVSPKPFTAEFARDVVKGVWKTAASDAVNVLTPVMAYKSTKLLVTDPGGFFGQYGQIWAKATDVGGAWCSGVGSAIDVAQGDKSFGDHMSSVTHSSLMGHIGNAWDATDADAFSETYTRGLELLALKGLLKPSPKPGLKPSAPATGPSEAVLQAQAVAARDALVGGDSATYVGAWDATTGQVTAAGSLRNSPTLGHGLCAEAVCVAELVALGSDVADISFTSAVGIRAGVVKQIPVCHYCQAAYAREQFAADAVPEPGGAWGSGG